MARNWTWNDCGEKALTAAEKDVQRTSIKWLARADGEAARGCTEDTDVSQATALEASLDCFKVRQELRRDAETLLLSLQASVAKGDTDRTDEELHRIGRVLQGRIREHYAQSESAMAKGMIHKSVKSQALASRSQDDLNAIMAILDARTAEKVAAVKAEKEAEKVAAEAAKAEKAAK